MRTLFLLLVAGMLSASTAGAQEPTPPPTQEPAPSSSPAPAGTWVPAPTPWPTATPTPAPTGTWTPVSPGGPPPPPPGPRDTFQQPLFTLQGKVGIHSYSGEGWGNLDQVRNDFDSGAVEAGLGIRFLDVAPLALEAVGEVGYYGGNACLDDLMGGCVDTTFSNVYGDVAGRAEVYAGQLGFYGQVGVGTYRSVERQQDPILGLNSSASRSTPSVHVALGLAADFTPAVRFFGEWKYVTADGAFPADPGNLDMGGSIVSLGMAVRFGLAPFPRGR